MRIPSWLPLLTTLTAAVTVTPTSVAAQPPPECDVTCKNGPTSQYCVSLSVETGPPARECSTFQVDDPEFCDPWPSPCWYCSVDWCGSAPSPTALLHSVSPSGTRLALRTVREADGSIREACTAFLVGYVTISAQAAPYRTRRRTIQLRL
jgi:hypothetical protein